MNFYHIDGDSVPCSNREHSPLCFCRSSYRRSLLTDLFISKISLSQCATSYSSRQCRQGRLSPSSTHVTQLVPNLVNYSHCLEDAHCLHTLNNTQRCQRCQITPSSLLTENISYIISTTTNHLPTDSCFYICEHDKSCGFLCFDRRITVTINCNICRGRRRNVTCRCINTKQPQSCLRLTTETTTPRWMQKRGFPAAGILALMVLATALLIIIIKLITRQLDLLAGRNTKTRRRSITTMTTYRSRQPSPSTAISYPNTPLIPSVQSRKDIVTANTMVELLNDKSREYVVDIHQRTNADDLGVFFLKRTSPLNPKSKEIINVNVGNEEREARI
ncbi:unnamed protein product [Rotaria sordida]|uniref:Uncharacterized protein n=1 Tax=Rotaria sordida TaxID=392033 RepID=A0A818H8M0_9BILA|nr:unnamed protein product [Rotaria sordida]CAF1047302.1 unnamed protein product [Rotaria sordida]CAF1049579.1 unnamed protein product [Rotaria sordida]CAF1051020.1 unnamed protein product [Rotaria sordida]CAF1147442.1 unnamed protein product [Rotaria sordida]